MLLAVVWFVSTYLAVGFWLLLLMVGTAWGGFSLSPSAWTSADLRLIAPGLVFTGLSIGTAIFVYRKVDRSWP